MRFVVWPANSGFLWFTPLPTGPGRPVESQLNPQTTDRQVAVASHNRVVDDVVAVSRPAPREVPTRAEVPEELIPILQGLESHADVTFPFQSDVSFPRCSSKAALVFLMRALYRRLMAV